ncbi:hypothetical protein CRENPOLYSF2_4160004 [Crenothrix polyspora]|uniref:Uncharacterized protein n=1 Tax=Crenothrix polyspora TaxID=360316 RepID=A0A1R4HEI9_9GAMM|nr:hypothetical protein CRENPOLYSF2_4160004 [Crenothrix polyspora]
MCYIAHYALGGFYESFNMLFIRLNRMSYIHSDICGNRIR